MQGAASLELYYNAHKSCVSAAMDPIRVQIKTMMPCVKSIKKVDKGFERKNNPQVKSSGLKTKMFSQTQIEKVILQEEGGTEVNNYLLTIKDPLWKRVCQDVKDLMGTASVLKIWKSYLGPFSSQDKYLNIICENEEIAAFIQQYDFVILGSLRKYFPTLKQLKAQTITSASGQ